MKYTKEILENAVKNCISYRQLLLQFGLKETGGNYTNIKNRIKKFNIDVSHFKGQSYAKNKIIITDIEHMLVENSTYSSGLPRRSSHIRERLIINGYRERKCEQCNLENWNNLLIPLELHHINGIKTDNRLENLQILCPNCHAQTDNYSGKNKKHSDMKS